MTTPPTGHASSSKPRLRSATAPCHGVPGNALLEGRIRREGLRELAALLAVVSGGVALLLLLPTWFASSVVAPLGLVLALYGRRAPGPYAWIAWFAAAAHTVLLVAFVLFLAWMVGAVA